MRGFACIGLFRPKDVNNVGGVVRAASVFGAAMVAIQGDRTPATTRMDTTKAYRHMPVIRGDDMFAMVPYDTIPVAVDLIAGAVALPDFVHPERAFYIFGPEDGTLGAQHMSRCKFVVSVPTAHCMNLAATVNVILYDRMAKQWRNQIKQAAE
jgi:tRNA(Leu) C34 or U34 (ribose-2'-O)-methylase TrmL